VTDELGLIEYQVVIIYVMILSNGMGGIWEDLSGNERNAEPIGVTVMLWDCNLEII
jgi:hypothetical protein